MIKVGTFAKLRRLYFRDKQSMKEICRQTGVSRNTVRSWLRDPEMVEPKYPARVVVSKLDAYTETLSLWLKVEVETGNQSWQFKQSSTKSQTVAGVATPALICIAHHHHVSMPHAGYQRGDLCIQQHSSFHKFCQLGTVEATSV